ncbi:unnamed protein product, partial [Timema podura]|nr:unnamed protein product [Timema podura]
MVQGRIVLACASLLICRIVTATVSRTNEGPDSWNTLARQELEASLKVQLNTGVARNVILFVGDGMGPNTVTATRIYKAQEGGKLAFEDFPHVGLLK